MNLRILAAIGLAAVCGLAGFAFGYWVHPTSLVTTHEVQPDVRLADYRFTCSPSTEPPFLQGSLSFALSSSYWTPVVAEVAYVGDWTGDTDQSLVANETKHVVVTWGPGMDQNIRVTECPDVTVRVWRITQTLEACPNPPC